MKSPGNHCYTDPAQNLVYESESCEDGQGRDIKNISNVGTAGVGPFWRKINDLLAFKNMNPVDASLLIADNPGSRTVDYGVNLSGVPGNTLVILGDGLYSGGIAGAPAVAQESSVGAVDGSNKTFRLNFSPVTKEACMGFLNGTRLAPWEYYVSGNEVILAQAPTLGSATPSFIYLYLATLPSSGSPEIPAGVIDGFNSSFTITSAPNDIDDFILLENGNFLTKDVDYTIVGTAITTTSPPSLGSSLQSYSNFLSSGSTGVEMVFERLLGETNSSNTVFKTSHPPVSVNSTLVFINGSSSYGPTEIASLSGRVITLASPPVASSQLWVSYPTYADHNQKDNEKIREIYTSGEVYPDDEVLIVNCTNANITLTLPAPEDMRSTMITMIKADGTSYEAILDGGSAEVGYGGGTSVSLVSQNSVLDVSPYRTRYLIRG